MSITEIIPEMPRVEPEPGRKIAVAVGKNRYQSQNGTDMLSVAFKFVHSKQQDAGALLVERFALVEKSVWRLARWAGAVGYTSKFNAMSDDDIDELMAKGALVLEGEEETYNNKTRCHVKTFLPYRGSFKKEWSLVVADGEKQWSEIQESLQARLTGSGNYGTTSNIVSTTTDDIPF